MKDLLTTIQPKRRSNVRAQITTALREMLLDGRLKEGDRVPASQKLAKLWDVPEPTVHRALTKLVKEGYLQRTPKVGTFVKQREKRLASIGIYTNDQVWRTPSGHSFTRVLCMELLDRLAEADIKTTIWTDSRPKAEQITPWPELMRAAAGRQFQILIAPAAGMPRILSLEKLPVPAVYLSTANIFYRVDIDHRLRAQHSLELLAAQGCRRVGVICPIFRSSEPEANQAYDSIKFFGMLQSEALRLGLELRPEWIMGLESGFKGLPMEHAQFGFDSLTALARQRDRPEGIVVYEDVTANGVLMALMREGSQFKLALHRNAEIGLFCPLPAAYVDIRIKELAEALILQAHRLFNGEEVSPILVKTHPVPIPKEP